MRRAPTDRLLEPQPPRFSEGLVTVDRSGSFFTLQQLERSLGRAQAAEAFLRRELARARQGADPALVRAQEVKLAAAETYTAAIGTLRAVLTSDSTATTGPAEHSLLPDLGRLLRESYGRRPPVGPAHHARLAALPPMTRRRVARGLALLAVELLHEDSFEYRDAIVEIAALARTASGGRR